MSNYSEKIAILTGDPNGIGAEITIKALNLFEDAQSQQNAKITLEKIRELKKGNGTATLIMLDPFGQSNVVSEKVEISEIPEEELKQLKTGFYDINE